MRRVFLIIALLVWLSTFAQERSQQYVPRGHSFVCENGTNRYTRALYGSHTDWRLETSDRPVFAVVKKGHHRNIRFEFEKDGVVQRRQRIENVFSAGDSQPCHVCRGGWCAHDHRMEL